MEEVVAKRKFQKTIDRNPEHPTMPFKGSWIGSWIGCFTKLFSINAHKVISSLEWRRTDGYEKMYAFHLSNLDTHRERGLTKGRATMASKEWKQSESGQSGLKNMRRSSQLPRGKTLQKIEALMRVKQIQDLFAADFNTLGQFERAQHARLLELQQTKDSKKLSTYIKQFVVFWKPWTPGGLRYSGDNCPDVDDFH